jgi:hypothetical protein
MAWLDARGGKKYKLLLVTLSGREYMIDLVSVGDVHDEPPFVAYEREDGFIETTESLYSSLDRLAIEHGCIVGEWTGVEPVN